MNPEAQKTRRKLYGRRKGPKLSPHQERLLETLLPELALTLEPARDPRRYFKSPVDDVWLEIGFGAGEHLLWQTEQHPNVGLIGAEPYISGVAKLLSKLASASKEELPLSPTSGGPVATASSGGQGEGASPSAPLFESERAKTPPHPSPLPPPTLLRSFGGLGLRPDEALAKSGRKWGRGENVRLYDDDARNILDALPDASLGRVFLLFPDPWPKTRHHKRRFVQMDTLDVLARVMKPGAEFRFASDDAGYLNWALERLTAHPAFAWTATRAQDWHTRTADWPQTRYEAKELHGKPAFLRFVRK